MRAPPVFISPMLAKLAASPPQGEGWTHELKLDGYRIQARIAGKKVTLRTRGGLDWTARLGGRLARALSRLECVNALIDGEVIVEDKRGASDFAALTDQLSRGDDSHIAYWAFDLLFLDGKDLRAEPLSARKAALRSLLGPRPPQPLRHSLHRQGDSARLLKDACKSGFEGVVSKRLDAPYTSDRGGAWIKSKCVARQEFVIAGFTNSTKLQNAVGALALGVYERGKLCYAGRIGTGFTNASAHALYARLKPLERMHPPFEKMLSAREGRGVTWVSPTLVAEVEFRAWTKEGLVRQGAFKGLREDKPAREIVAERVPRRKG